MTSKFFYYKHFQNYQLYSLAIEKSTFFNILIEILPRCVENGGEKWDSEKSKVVNRVEMWPETEVSKLQF